ncbi:MAG: ABC transporter ATP-binding protein [Desulfosporosinus sp.]|nr:ABC transporter ATP-binding protein [Desulfosporosinus sp.]
MDIIKKLYYIFDREQKMRFAILVLLMIGGALLETVGIGLIIPIINLVLNPDLIFKQKVLLKIYEVLNFKSSTSFLIVFCFTMLVVFIIKNSYAILMYKLQFQFINREHAKISTRLLKKYLYKPYTYHLQRNSSELLRNINTDVEKLFEYIMTSLCLLLAEVMVVLSILILLLFVEPVATIFAAGFLLVSILIFMKLFRKKLRDLGKKEQYYRGQTIKWVNQSLGAIKEIKVLKKEDFFYQQYEKQINEVNSTRQYIQTLNQIPRPFIETLAVGAMLIIIIIILMQSKAIAAQNILPALGLFGLAAFRLMPSINRIMNSISNIQFAKPSLNEIYTDLLTEPVEAPKAETTINTLKDSKIIIELNKISFKYPDSSKWILNDCSFSIKEGESIGIIGSSGAGKTTFVDIILGVLQPTKGEILTAGMQINDKADDSVNFFGYIPQNIYLIDDSIRRNIAFGTQDDNINDNLIWQALRFAQLEDFVLSLPDKLDTLIGEQGVRLSGGQRQRLGIARALYFNPRILIFDEATSSLDIATEKEIIKSIDFLKGVRTLLIISHRPNTVDNVDRLLEIKDGSIIEKKLREFGNDSVVS